MWNQENTTKETANRLFTALTKLSEEVARLQEQQKIDTATSERYRKELDELRTAIANLNNTQTGLQHLLPRIQYLETNLSAEFKEQFLSLEAFEAYQYALRQERLEIEKATLEKAKKLKIQIGLIAGTTFATIAPKLGELILWLISKIQH